jgi:hypothetical protein
MNLCYYLIKLQDNVMRKSVVFRKEGVGDIIALFPYEVENNALNLISCYSHIGQHSTADYDAVVNQSEPANKKEYTNLFDELCFLGYDLQIIENASKRKMAIAFNDRR